MAALGPAPDVPPEVAGLASGPPPGAPPSIMVGGEGPPGGGGPPGPGGMPPELAGMGGGGPPPGEEAAEGGGSPLDILDEVRNLLMEYLTVEQDDIDKKAGAALLKGVQDLFAKNQQEEEAASGTTPAMKGMAKALGG